MANGKELRIGVIGAGGRGSLAHHAHQPDDGARLVAAVDVVPKVLDEWQEKFGRDTFVTNDYRKLLARDDVEAVFVCSPDYLHEEHALAALNAGKHVYLEKPMAITIAGCDRILKTAYEKKLKLYLGHNMRHMSFVQKMKELIDSGAIGEVRAGWCRHFIAYGCDAYFKDWHADRTKSTGLLLQKAAHDIDVLHWLCGGYTVRTNAMGSLSVYNRITDRHAPEERGDASFVITNWPPLSQKQLNPVIDVEDLSMMHMQLDNGVLCSYQQCHYAPDSWRNYTILGTEGRIENFGDNPTPDSRCVIGLWNQRCEYLPQGNVQHEIPVDPGTHGGADPKIVAEFVRYVREGGKVLTSPIAARNSVAAGCQATESLRNGGVPLDIPPVPKNIADYFNADLAK